MDLATASMMAHYNQWSNKVMFDAVAALPAEEPAKPRPSLFKNMAHTLNHIYVINRISFGWTLQFAMQPEIYLQAGLTAIVAAVLAGIYPAWRIARVSPAVALREE